MGWLGSCGSVGSGTCGRFVLPSASNSCVLRSVSASVRVVRPVSVGSVSPLGVAKLKALVRSPHTARRNGEMWGSLTPKRASMKRSTEVWSNT
ncbi:hypothetical protein D3C87_1343080 [compost metagenome]